MSDKKIGSALISVFYKDGLDPIVQKLHSLGVELFSTGGTYDYIKGLDIPVTAVEEVTDYPSIFDGRVKTLHPKLFGGILFRRGVEDHVTEQKKYEIPAIDLVIVDLYPFEETAATAGASEEEIIEKIDIGGIALIRGAAKNFNDVLIVPSRAYYAELLEMLDQKSGKTSLDDRTRFATRAFDVSSHYDTAIFTYLNAQTNADERFKFSEQACRSLRYGENPHQRGQFFGKLEDVLDQVHGKDISYNNLIDIDAAVNLISEFDDQTAFGILKHNNACGFATGESVLHCYEKALSADPLSAFGGVLVANTEIDRPAASEIHKLFFEIIIAPSYASEALEILKQKKNRIILIQKTAISTNRQFRSLLNGVIAQDPDRKTDQETDMKTVTKRAPTPHEIKAMVLASKLSKHSKSNTIVLANESHMISSGVGQTSRVDALEQAIAKARKFELSPGGAVMASDAFFPFPDCVEIADQAGIKAVIQPGGSVKDQLSIDYCDSHDMAMVFTGIRHFKH